MSIFGIGTDLAKLQRFEEMYQRHGERLVRHLLLPAEAELFSASKRPARFLALHWAAKEAAVKAMGTGFAHGMWIRDVGYLPDAKGKPELIWSEHGNHMRQQLGIGDGYLSLSDEEGFVVAMVVLMRT